MSKENVRREPAIPNGIVGMIFFIIAEVMMFAALISAYMILRAGVPVWPPWGQPTLPIGITAFNTLILLTSGILLVMSKRKHIKGAEAAEVKKTYFIAMVLGTIFVAIQGFEWVQLIAQGLTLTSSTYGGLFYLIIGMHAFHAVAALIGLYYVFNRIGKLDAKGTRIEITSIQIFWLFVVGVWPILYVTVYLW